MVHCWSAELDTALREPSKAKGRFRTHLEDEKVPRVIAERLLHIAGAERTMVTVRIHEPEMRPADAVDADIPWMCAIELDGMPTIPGFPTRMHMGQGLDSLEALVNALFVARCVLDAAERKLGIQCVWPVIEHRQGGHAVPTPIMTELGPTFEAEMIALMQQRQLEFILRERDVMQRMRDFDGRTNDDEDDPDN
jgi:hypothetical protein